MCTFRGLENRNICREPELLVGYFLGLGDVGISGCEHLDSHDLSFECGIARVCCVSVSFIVLFRFLHER